MIAALVVAFAAVAQASTIKWKNGVGINAYNQPGDDGAAYVGTIYLMVGGTDAATMFINTVLAAESDYAAKFGELVGSSVASMNHANFNPAAYTFESTIVGNNSFYVVALDTANDGVYMSEVVNKNIAGVGNSDVIFSHDAAYKNSAFGTDVTTYSGDGWYTAAPEPTSGLLLLIGMAGLALKRKIA